MIPSSASDVPLLLNGRSLPTWTRVFLPTLAMCFREAFTLADFAPSRLQYKKVKLKSTLQSYFLIYIQNITHLRFFTACIGSMVYISLLINTKVKLLIYKTISHPPSIYISFFSTRQMVRQIENPRKRIYHDIFTYAILTPHYGIIRDANSRVLVQVEIQEKSR